MTMRRQIILLGMMLAAIFTLTNCVKEIDNPVPESTTEVPFEIIASVAETKTVNDGLKTLWEQGDRISLFYAISGQTTYEKAGGYDDFIIEDVETGRFTGTLESGLDLQESYDWYAYYPGTASNNLFEIRASIGGSKQKGYGNMSHLGGSPLYGLAKTWPAKNIPELEMRHLLSVVALNVTNNTDVPIMVTTASLTAEEDISGRYLIDITGDSVVYTKTEDESVSNTASVDVTYGTTSLLKGESAVLYLKIKPFIASAGEKLIISVNGYEKELIIQKDVAFSAGKIKTINFSYDRNVSVDEAFLEAELVKCWEAQYAGNGAWMKHVYEFVENASALIGWKDNRTEDWVQARRLTLNPDNARNSDNYDFLYNGINTCNYVMDILNTNAVDPSLKNEVEGEARFIRGWMYFSLVRYYGDVPLILERTSGVADPGSSRTSYLKVYEQILEDLNFAEKNMRTSERQAAVTGGRLCRPHRWAATAMKALVYTQIACLIENIDYQFFDASKSGRYPDFTFAGITSAEDAWIKALETAESVINCGEYALESDYGALFDWGSGKPVYQSKERILVLQNGNTTGLGSYVAIRTLPPYWNGATVNTNHGRIRPSRFPVVKWCRVHGGTPWTDRNDNLTGLYMDCHDPRFDVSYIHTSYTNMSTGKSVSIYPNTGNGVRSSTYYMPYFRKYSDSEYDVTPGYADMYMIRLAEMYLIAAEACASLSMDLGDHMCQKALVYMEFLHARARQSGVTHATSPSMSNWNISTREDLINAIMWERVFELHGEGCHEFFDTHRRGGKWMAEWLTKPLNEFHTEPEQTYMGPSGSFSYFSRYWGSTILPEDPQELRKVLLIPIPSSEELPQNDFHL